MTTDFRRSDGVLMLYGKGLDGKGEKGMFSRKVLMWQCGLLLNDGQICGSQHSADHGCISTGLGNRCLLV